MRVFLGLAAALAAGLLGGRALAADALAFGPAPDWVEAVSSKAPDKPAEAGPPVRAIRFDQQVRFGSDGDGIYQESVSQVRTALGLQTLGTIRLSWNPADETITVHKVQILRGGQVIDVLAKQSFSIIRREEDLEHIVDGRLTATLQPEDLRVGDILDVAYTLDRKDRELQGHTDLAWSLGGMARVEQVSIRATWPTNRPIAWRVGDGLPKPKVVERNGVTRLSLDLEGLEPPKIPRGAPRRYWPTRELEFSDFKSWAEVAGTVAPLFAKASTLGPDSALDPEIERIAAASDDPKVRAAAALKLVQDQVRYLGLILADGGYTPVDAETTWKRRFGECKAKAVLLTALLRRLGIEAEPALVNAYGGDGVEKGLPRMSAFNHVIVRAVIGGRVHWLDGTRTGDGALDALEVPTHGWALPLRAEGSQLVALVRKPRGAPDREVRFDIDATAGIEAAAPVKAEMIVRGDAGLWPALMISTLTPADRERMLKEMWSSFPWVEVKTAAATRDAQTGESRMTMEGTARLQWFRSPNGPVFVVPGAGLGYRADFKRDDDQDQDAPYSVPYPSSAAYSFRLKLPLDGRGFTIPALDVDRKVAGRHFVRRAQLADGRLVIETQVDSLAEEFPASEAKAAEVGLAEMANTHVYVTGPAGYQATPADIEAWLAQEPKTAQDFIVRGAKLVEAGRLDSAEADFESAMAIDPASAWAYAGRGGIRLARNQLELARADYEKAGALDERNPAAVGGLGDIALREGRYQDAVDAYTRANYLAPSNLNAFLSRARAYVGLRDYDRALSDVDQVLRLAPGQAQARHLKAGIYATRLDYDRALAELDAMLADGPGDAATLFRRAELEIWMGRREAADKDLAQAVSLEPKAASYLHRARLGAKLAADTRLADIDRAVSLGEGEDTVAPVRAQVLIDAGRSRDAIAVLDRALRRKPRDAELLAMRGEARARGGDKARALADFDASRALVRDDSVGLNRLCWTLGTLGIALETALADCDASLKLDANSSNTLDSRGLVLLRLGRLDESIAAYDAAARTRPYQAETLYGRGLAKLRLGRTDEGETDLAMALKASAMVEDDFKGYGLSR